MDHIIVQSYDTSLQTYGFSWIKEITENPNKRDYYRNPTASLYTSMVYGFAKHLPYSMDIEQPEYVPADFLNMVPADVEENDWFKWEDRRTFFNSMIRWGDTFKSGMILQMCSIFQKMILGEFPADFELCEENYSGWGIDSMTKDQEYNRCFFETLKTLPSYYQKVVTASNRDERRSALDQMYADIIQKIAARFGGFQETDTNGNVIREQKGTIPIVPYRDVEMRVYWDQITFHDGIPQIIEAIKKEQLQKYVDRQSLGLTDLQEDRGIRKK